MEESQLMQYLPVLSLQAQGRYTSNTGGFITDPLTSSVVVQATIPLYDGGNQGVRRRQLHDILRHPGYDSMLAARGEGLPEDH